MKLVEITQVRLAIVLGVSEAGGIVEEYIEEDIIFSLSVVTERLRRKNDPIKGVRWVRCMSVYTKR